MDGPNPITALISMLSARRLRRPEPIGTGSGPVDGLDEVLEAVAGGGIASVPPEALRVFLKEMAQVDPDMLSRDGALAYWINLYNAGAIGLARRAYDSDRTTVLKVPGGFGQPFIEVSGERLSLDGIEHGKIRRFEDPRIHSALVCGSVSCPTLRHEAYREDRLDRQLDAQMRSFLTAGAAVADRKAGTVALSRVFRWYGGDFVRPHRMPTLRPGGGASTLAAITPWLDGDLTMWINQTAPRVVFQDYDWGLGCSVRPKD